jgi:hypothetical protein
MSDAVNKQMTALTATMKVNLAEQENKLKYMKTMLVLGRKAGEDTEALEKMVDTVSGMIALIRKTLKIT